MERCIDDSCLICYRHWWPIDVVDDDHYSDAIDIWAVLTLLTTFICWWRSIADKPGDRWRCISCAPVQFINRPRYSVSDDGRLFDKRLTWRADAYRWAWCIAHCCCCCCCWCRAIVSPGDHGDRLLLLMPFWLFTVLNRRVVWLVILLPLGMTGRAVQWYWANGIVNTWPAYPLRLPITHCLLATVWRRRDATLPWHGTG